MLGSALRTLNQPNLALLNGGISDDLKIVKVTPICKAG